MVPTEVLENIFTYLVPREGGYYDLWQSSLVCRAWRDPAQRLAFCAIRVLTHKDWVSLLALVSQNAVIGSHIINITIEFDFTGEDEADERVSALFPSVTHLAFFSSVRETSLVVAARFHQLKSLVTSRTGTNTYLSGDDTSMVALTELTCLPSVLLNLIEWLDETASARRESLVKVRVTHE
jgi:hypothetical protein